MLTEGDLPSAYKEARRQKQSNERIVFLMSSDELKALDEWGVPAGMRSRAEAIRVLIRKGLEAVSHANS